MSKAIDRKIPAGKLIGCGEAKGHLLGFVKFDKNSSASFISEEWP